MKLQIIETPDYILAVSDEKVNPGEYGLITSAVMTYDQIIKEWKESIGRKIIAYQPKGNAPKLDLPLLPEMVVEDDVEKLAENIWILLTDGKDVCVHKGDWSEGFKQGHRAATKVYSEEDLRKAFEAGWKKGRFGNYPKEHKEYQPNFTEFIQSLKHPKTPKYFVAEMETNYYADDTWASDGGYYTKRYSVEELKATIINDKTYLVGTYLYN